MASTRINLDPQTVEAISRRVVQLLRDRDAGQAKLVDAAELARRLGVERSWVYTHAIELGVIKLGEGARPRLRFDPRVANERIRKAALGQDTEKPPPADRPGPPMPCGENGRPPLLPIRGGGGN